MPSPGIGRLNETYYERLAVPLGDPKLPELGEIPVNWYHTQFWFRPDGLTDSTHIIIHIDTLAHTVEEASEKARVYLKSIMTGGDIVLNFAGRKSACCCWCPREE